MHSFVELALIWTAVLAAGFAARLTRLTPVLWFLFAGVVMVNLGWLPEHPEPFIEGLAELGIIVIMFALGFEESTENFLGSLKKSWGIAFFGGVAPFAAAYGVAYFFWGSVPIALMVGLAMTATAVSLTMVSLKAEGLHTTPAATRIMTSAVLDDIASLALVAILVPIAAGTTQPNLLDVGVIALKTIAFFVIISVLGAWVFPHEPRAWVRKIPFIGGWGIRQILVFGKGEHATLSVLLIAVVVGLMATEFGFHPAVGAYMAGLILKEEYFLVDSEESSYTATRRIVESAAYSWIGPVFFVVLGARVLLDIDLLVSIIPHTIALTVCLVVAQITSAALAARYTGDMNWPGAVMIGFGMLGRAELAFVVMDIAYRQNAILPVDAFYTLMLTAFALNVLVPVTIRLWKPVYVRSLAP